MGNKLCIKFFRNTNAINTEKLLENESTYKSLDINDLSYNKNINSYNECFPYGMEILK